VKRLRALIVVSFALVLAGCTSPGELAAYEALDQGWKQIEPFANEGLAARPGLTEAEKVFIRQTFTNHRNLIVELKNGGRQ
jgi:hypothetical protein